MLKELSRQEAIKLFTQRYPYLLLGMALLIQTITMISKASTPAQTSLEVLSSPQLWANGVQFGLRLSTYLILVVGAMAISREFSLGTIKTFLVLPIQRRQWVAAKIVALLALALVVLLILTLLGIVIVALFLGWGPVVREEVELYTQAQVWSNLFLASSLTLAFMLPMCAFSLLVGSYFTSSGAAVGVSLLLWTVLESIAEILDVGSWLFPYYLSKALDQVEKMGKGLPFQWDSLIQMGLPVTLGSFLLLIFWLFTRIEKMDITE